jgi:GNAT acetyltransferase-like protein
MADELLRSFRGQLSKCLFWLRGVHFGNPELLDASKVRSRGGVVTVGVAVRRADWDADGDALLKFLQEHLSSSIDLGRFNWLYRNGPCGEAKGWLAVEEKGRLIGAAAVFPRKMNLAGQAKMGCVFGDFCISPDHRSLGPALQLQRKCLESVSGGGFSVGYDLPSTSMLAIYRRLGIETEGKLTRMTKLLRTNSKISTRVKSQTLAAGISAAANVVLSAYLATRRLQSGVSIELHKGRFGTEFDDLYERAGPRLGISVERSSDYLNWRYADHPQDKYEVLVARRGGNLEGYLVFQQQDVTARVTDLIAESAAVRGDLIRGMVELERARKCEAINVAVLKSHSLCAELGDLGFRARESVPAVFIGAPEVAVASTRWFLLDGDRES